MVTTIIHHIGTSMFSDSVKQTITTQVRLNHCLPARGVWWQIACWPITAVWHSLSGNLASSDRSASSEICSLCPLPHPNSENGKCTASHTHSSSSRVLSVLGTVKAEIGGKGFGSSSITHRDAAGQGVSTCLVCSQRVSFVHRLRMRASPARNTKPRQSSALPISHDHNRLYYA